MLSNASGQKGININSESVGYAAVFMSIAKCISTEKSREVFAVLCGQKPLDVLSQEILVDS